MPNGGTHHCGLYCCHFDNGTNNCNLRHVQIEQPCWTTCKNFNRPNRTIVGPLYAIVCEVKSGAGGYGDIPYFDGRRVDTVQRDGKGDTVVCFTDRNGQHHEFASVADYLENYKNNRPSSALLRLQISREEAKAFGHQTVEILQAGYYINASGTRVDIDQQVDEAVRCTVSYPPETELPVHSSHRGKMVVEVRNETTLQAVEYLRSKGFEPAALNFASAESPGGGFLRGARAQEEYLARSSALWACLRDNAMYSYHRGRQDPFYSDYVIYSPNVPVLRNDAGELLETPYSCSIITSPAVHANGVRRYMPARMGEITSAMWHRILKVLAVAERHGHKSLVLGAWGCGAFGNDGNEIAKLFRKALEGNFCGAFDYILFAITDWSEDERFIGPFMRNFGDGQIHCGIQEAIMYGEFEGEWRAIFETKPYQGQDPEKAKILFVGRDANYPDDLCKHPFFERVKEYHRDGVAFWVKYKVHHPFLCNDFPDEFPKNKGGRPYHKNFTKIGLDPTHAPYISFIELRELPTRGVTGSIPKSVFISSLTPSHMQLLDRWISQSGRKLVFLPKTIREDMQKFRKDDRNLFQFLNFSPPVPLNASGLPVIYADHDVLVLATYHFSARQIFGITSQMKTVMDLFLQGHQVPLMETGKTCTQEGEDKMATGEFDIFCERVVGKTGWFPEGRRVWCW
jgi:uncharacterized protein (TIGR02452 family)